MEFVQENSNVARESLEEALSSEPIPEQDINETKVDVKDANEESSSTDDKEVEPEADPEAKP